LRCCISCSPLYRAAAGSQTRPAAVLFRAKRRRIPGETGGWPRLPIYDNYDAHLGWPMSESIRVCRSWSEWRQKKPDYREQMAGASLWAGRCRGRVKSSLASDQMRLAALVSSALAPTCYGFYPCTVFKDALRPRSMPPRAGLERATIRLTVECSTTELQGMAVSQRQKVKEAANENWRPFSWIIRAQGFQRLHPRWLPMY
jgi:hypothetical protein